MAAAVRTKDLGPYHAMRSIAYILNFARYRFVKGGPATAAVKLATAFEKGSATASTAIGPLVEVHIVGPRKRPLGTLLP